MQEPTTKWLVRGYTKTGVYAEIVTAWDEEEALIAGKEAIAKLKPLSPIISYRVTEEED